MKRSTIIAAALGGVLALVLVITSVKRIPESGQTILVGKDSRVARVAPGIRFILPFSGTLVTLPAGRVEQRVPEAGSYRVLTEDGLEASVALNLRLDVGSGSAEAIYETLGGDFALGVSTVLEDALEIETARWRSSVVVAQKASYVEAVLKEAFRTLFPIGVGFSSYKIEELVVEVGEEAAVNVTVTESPLRRVVFVGVDGADWKMIDAMIGQGLLPNFKKLKQDGVTGPLRSIEPLLSPLIWTTMATGKLPEDHGILNFTVVDSATGRKVPISRLYRRVDAFWNMLGDYDRTVDVVGWLATFPAEAINGVMVTDRVGYLAYADAEASATGAQPGTISPETRVSELSERVVRSGRVTYDEFKPFIKLDEHEFVTARSAAFDPKDPVNNMIMLYASTQTFRRIATHLLATDRPDFLGVYFELVDATKHLFMHYAPPKLPQVDAVNYERFKDAVHEAYVLQDIILGEIIALCDDNTVLVVASDHGFRSGESRPTVRPEIWAGRAASWHTVDGILCVYGSGIRAGATIDNASILDITPTLLAFAGLPKPADMPGKVLTEIFDDSLAARLNDAEVATLQRRRSVDVASLPDAAATDEIIEKLEALGYITPENPDAHNNLGQRYQQNGEFEKAVAEFKKALELNPNFPSALNNLGVCYGQLRRYREAEASFRSALALNPRDVYAMNNLAIMFMEIGQFDRAVDFGEQAVTVEPNYSNGHLTLGSIYATLGRLDDAEREFNKTLEIDPSNQKAIANLEKIEAARNP